MRGAGAPAVLAAARRRSWPPWSRGAAGAGRRARPLPGPAVDGAAGAPRRAAAAGAVRALCAPASPAVSATRRRTSSAASCAAARRRGCCGATTTRAPGRSSSGCAPTGAWPRARSSRARRPSTGRTSPRGRARMDGRCSTSATSATTRDGGRRSTSIAWPSRRSGAGATAPAARLRLRYPDARPGRRGAARRSVARRPRDRDQGPRCRARLPRVGPAPRGDAGDAAPRPGDRALPGDRRRRERRRPDRRPARLRPARGLGAPRARATDDDPAAGRRACHPRPWRARARARRSRSTAAARASLTVAEGSPAVLRRYTVER